MSACGKGNVDDVVRFLVENAPFSLGECPVMRDAVSTYLRCLGVGIEFGLLVASEAKSERSTAAWLLHTT